MSMALLNSKLIKRVAGSQWIGNCTRNSVSPFSVHITSNVNYILFQQNNSFSE